MSHAQTFPGDLPAVLIPQKGPRRPPDRGQVWVFPVSAHTDADEVAWVDDRAGSVKEIHGVKVDAAHLRGFGAACCLAGWNFFSLIEN